MAQQIPNLDEVTEFFDLLGETVVAQWRGRPITIEQLYQMFRSRIFAELIATDGMVETVDMVSSTDSQPEPA